MLLPGRCRGFMYLAPRHGDGGEKNRLAGGWMWDVSEMEPAYLVIADTDGVIRGLGNVNRTALKMPDGRRGVRWAGFLPDFDDAESYAAYAVLKDGRRACRLAVTRPEPGRS